MKRLFFPALVLIILGLSQCHSKEQKNIIGVWQLQQITVNGTTIPGGSMGNLLWEFNEAGGYLTDVGGMREKGLYTLKDSVLTLKLGKDKNRPAQVYKVARLDSVLLDINFSDNRTNSSMRFLKRSAGDFNQDKD